jgi:SagB-type dehydrogenase family enzyme
MDFQSPRLCIQNRYGWSLVLVVCLGLLLTTCTAPDLSLSEKPDSQVPAVPIDDGVIQTPQPILLPQPQAMGSLSLEETLAKRRSVREFAELPLTMEELGQLLWAAQGVTHPHGYRTAPSAGGLYPLELFVVKEDGLFHYDPAGHQIMMLQEGDLRPALHAASLRQEPVLRAPAVFLIAAVFERTEAKYGRQRTPRYVYLEAGHAAQNLLLQAVALELGAVPIGAFHDEKVKEILSLPSDHQPLYLIPVGHPR